MDYIFSDKAKSNLIEFTKSDKIDVLAFSGSVNNPWSATGDNTSYLLSEINNHNVGGSTALYPATEAAINILKNESSEYNTSVILMTDGEGNVGSFKDLEKTYKNVGKEIPIYSITFGDADINQLNKMATLSNGKVFDGRNNLVEAFKTVRGYN